MAIEFRALVEREPRTWQEWNWVVYWLRHWADLLEDDLEAQGDRSTYVIDDDIVEHRIVHALMLKDLLDYDHWPNWDKTTDSLAPDYYDVDEAVPPLRPEEV